LTFLEILEGLGGFLQIVTILSTILVLPINSFFYTSFLIRNFYLYENKIPDDKQVDGLFVNLQEKIENDNFSMVSFSKLR